ncbi:MAG: right-handed parallel beta-helix repeat-containing protein [Aquincola sp.]|nr:right-handed parallel beta-helix repeat-containing protein [Aquincola sp.]
MRAIRRSAIWASSQRCIVIHGTSGVAVADNVCHDIRGHAVFLEDGNERRNVIERNLVLGVRTPKTPLKLHDRVGFMVGPSGFWLTNPDNVLRGNVAADAEGNGFWLAYGRKPSGDAAGLALLPDRLPFGVFDDNVAHSNGQVGINLDFAPIDEAGNTAPNKYIPTADGGENRWDNQIRAAMRRNVNLEKHRRGFLEPHQPARLQRLDQRRQRRRALAGAATTASSAARCSSAKASTTAATRKTPSPPRAFATYHSTYAMRDNTLVAFDHVPGKSSGAFRTNDYYTLGVDKGTVRNANNRLIASHPGQRTMPPNLDAAPLANRHWTYAGALWDPHGYWGAKGQYWVIDHPFLTAGAQCQSVAPAGSNGQSCAGEYYGVGSFQTDFDPSRYSFMAAIDVTRQDSQGNPLASWSVADGATSTMLGNMRHFAARPQGRYVLRFPGKPNPKWFAMSVGNAYRASDSFVIGIAFDGNTPAAGYTVSGHEHHRLAPPEPNTTRAFSPAQSLGEVIAGNGSALWQDRANHLVWVKVQGGMAWPHPATAAHDDQSLYRALSVVLHSR